MSIEAQGTIKVKNVNGELVPFMPKTDIRSIKNRETGSTAYQTISAINEEIESRNAESPIKVMYEMPTDANTETLGSKSLIGTIIPAFSEKRIFLGAKLSDPANGSFFAYGEKFKIIYEIFNASSSKVTNAKIKPGDRTSVKNINLDVAEVGSATYEGTIELNDVTWCINNNKSKSIPAVMSFSGSDSFSFLGDPTVKINCIPTDQSFYDPSLSSSLTTSSPDGSFDTGNIIRFAFNVGNYTKGPLDGPVYFKLTDSDGTEYASLSKTIDMEKTAPFNVDVTITENDILNHSTWAFTFVASATNFLGVEKSTSYSTSIALVSPNPKLKISYAIKNSPASGNLWTDEETVSYKIIAANTGNLTLTNVLVTDQNSSKATTIASIAPKETIEIEDEAFVLQIPAGNANDAMSCTATVAAAAPNELSPVIQIKPLSILTDKANGFTCTVNTSSTSGTTSIPLSTTDSETEIKVDWGDGTSSIINSSTTDYTHTYAIPETYTISATSSNWSETSFVVNESTSTVSSSTNPTLYWFRNTLASLDGKMPNVKNTSLAYCFTYCTKLASISEDFFSNCASKTRFAYCFYKCSGLKTVSSNLFKNCTGSTSFYYCFYQCTSLTTIDSNVFENCNGSTTFAYCFYGCTALKTISSGVFKDCTGSTSFFDCFYGCTALKTISNDIFENCSGSATFAYCFYGCTALTTIPSNIFKDCTGSTSFEYCFGKCTALKDIPENLFKDCTNVTQFDYCFYQCTALTTIPSTIFANCTGVTSVIDLFYGCSALLSLPEGLFASCTGILSFAHLCNGCTNLKTVPADLFKYSTNATNISSIFRSCKSIESIPEDLLRYNVAVTNVGAFFANASIPAFNNFPVDFLKYNVNVTTLMSDSYGFFEGASIQSFSLRIGSPSITNISYFISTSSSATRIIYVPAGSTTKTTFENYSSTFIIIEE